MILSHIVLYYYAYYYIGTYYHLVLSTTRKQIPQMASVITPSVLTVHISSSLRSVMSEKRFPKDLTIGDLKDKLEMITGATSSMMDLEVFDERNKFVCKLDNNVALLGSYPIENNMRIHVINKDPGRGLGEFDDVSKVEKYEMDQSEYAEKTDSVLAFKKKNKIGRFADKNPEDEERKAEAERKEEDKANAISVGSRCLVTQPGIPPRKGQVMFVGKTEFKPGWWIGIKCDEPVGKNDGSVKGKRYFECPPKYGSFVKPACVEVGDFPEDDFEDEM